MLGPSSRFDRCAPSTSHRLPVNQSLRSARGAFSLIYSTLVRMGLRLALSVFRFSFLRLSQFEFRDSFSNFAFRIAFGPFLDTLFAARASVANHPYFPIRSELRFATCRHLSKTFFSPSGARPWSNTQHP